MSQPATPLERRACIYVKRNGRFVIVLSVVFFLEAVARSSARKCRGKLGPCHEGNLSMIGILAGARADEAKAAKAAAAAAAKKGTR